jgi:hypothetical protein
MGTFVYWYICVPVHLCTGTFVYGYICVPVHLCTGTFLYGYICVPVHLCTGTIVYGYNCVRVHLCTGTSTFVYRHFTGWVILYCTWYLHFAMPQQAPRTITGMSPNNSGSAAKQWSDAAGGRMTLLVAMAKHPVARLPSRQQLFERSTLTATKISNNVSLLF